MVGHVQYRSDRRQYDNCQHQCKNTDERFAAARTVCLIDEENVASVRVAEKCGYGVFERTVFNERPTLFLAREARGHPAA